MTYAAAIRVLLEGTTGANISAIVRETRLGRNTIVLFLRDPRHESSPTTVDVLGDYVWRKINAHLLLCDEDRRDPRHQPLRGDPALTDAGHGFVAS